MIDECKQIYDYDYIALLIEFNYIVVMKLSNHSDSILHRNSYDWPIS